MAVGRASTFMENSLAVTVQTIVFENIPKFLSNSNITSFIIREPEINCILDITGILYDLFVCGLSSFTARETILGVKGGGKSF